MDSDPSHYKGVISPLVCPSDYKKFESSDNGYHLFEENCVKTVPMGAVIITEFMANPNVASDSKALLEKSKREGFFMIFIIAIELLSNAHLIAEVMNIINIKKRKLIQLAEEQQTHKDIMGAVEHIMNVNIANDIKGLTKKGEMYNTMSKMQTLNSLSQMSNQVETTKQNIIMLGRVNNIVRDTNKEAMESVQHQLNAIRAERENAQLKLLLSEAMKND